MTGVGGHFEVGTGFLPGFEDSMDKDGGVIIGGASLWMLDKCDEKLEKAAWEFIKYMISPEQQVFWNKDTGYFPITTKAYELDEMNKHLEKFPQFRTAIDQLHDTPINTAIQGALIGVFPEARQIIETNIEAMIAGSMTPEKALNKAAEDINKAIDNYNKTVK